MNYIPKLRLVTIVLSIFIIQYTYAADDQCLSCHQGLEDKPSQLFMEDVHYKAGLSCSSCHGGNSNSDDMDMAMSKSEGFIGVPVSNNISQICSKCHSDIDYMKKYNSNIHYRSIYKTKRKCSWEVSRKWKRNDAPMYNLS